RSAGSIGFRTVVAWAGDARGARHSGAARRRRSRCARSRGAARHSRIWRLASARRTSRRAVGDDGVPRRRSSESQPDRTGNERPVARHGSDRARIAMQSRTTDVVSAVARGSRSFVHARTVIATVLLMGPTASGKSAVALDIAQRFGGEIVSVDSAQVYRGMDIGTAKPDAATRAKIPHHLIDIVDPTDAYSAARFAPNDAQRIQRALEVYELTGRPLSQLQGNRSQPAIDGGATISIALVPRERSALHIAIARRFDAMLAAGLVEELVFLRDEYPLHRHLPSMRCVGYRQAWSYLEGEIDRATLRAQGIAATRQLAKRQFTWLRTIDAATFDPNIDGTLAAIATTIESAL